MGETAAETILRHLQAGPAGTLELLDRIRDDDSLPGLGEPSWRMFTTHTVTDALDAVMSFGRLVGHDYVTWDEATRRFTLHLPEAPDA